MPAHVTLLYPFIPPDSITLEDRRLLAELFSHYPTFNFALVELKRFPDVLYLAPFPIEKIMGLVKAIFAAFPGYPPYQGQFAEITPHLTIAQNEDNVLLEDLHNEIAAAAKPVLPIYKYVYEISLLEEHDGWWSRTGAYPLKGQT